MSSFSSNRSLFLNNFPKITLANPTLRRNNYLYSSKNNQNSLKYNQNNIFPSENNYYTHIVILGDASNQIKRKKKELAKSLEQKKKEKIKRQEQKKEIEMEEQELKNFEKYAKEINYNNVLNRKKEIDQMDKKRKIVKYKLKNGI